MGGRSAALCCPLLSAARVPRPCVGFLLFCFVNHRPLFTFLKKRSTIDNKRGENVIQEGRIVLTFY